MIVKLSLFEVMHAAQCGVLRRVTALKNDRRDRYGAPAYDVWGTDIEACCAEMAVAKAIGSYWNPVVSDPTFLFGDVGRIQVRSTARDDGCLLLHPTDPDDAAFVLVTGRAPTYRLVGWIRGAAGKQQCWWRQDTGRPCYFVPQSSLEPVETLPAER